MLPNPNQCLFTFVELKTYFNEYFVYQFQNSKQILIKSNARISFLWQIYQIASTPIHTSNQILVTHTIHTSKCTLLIHLVVYTIRGVHICTMYTISHSSECTQYMEYSYKAHCTPQCTLTHIVVYTKYSVHTKYKGYTNTL